MNSAALPRSGLSATGFSVSASSCAVLQHVPARGASNAPCVGEERQWKRSRKAVLCVYLHERLLGRRHVRLLHSWLVHELVPTESHPRRGSPARPADTNTQNAFWAARKSNRGLQENDHRAGGISRGSLTSGRRRATEMRGQGCRGSRPSGGW